MDFKHQTVSSTEHAAKPDKKALTTDDIINDIKRLFNDHLNDYNAQLVQERKEHAITKQCLAELKATLGVVANEKSNLEKKLKDQENRMDKQEEILRSYEERFVNQEEILRSYKERFVNQKEILRSYEERENKHYKGMCMASIGITMALCGIFFFIRK